MLFWLEKAELRILVFHWVRVSNSELWARGNPEIPSWNPRCGMGECGGGCVGIQDKCSSFSSLWALIDDSVPSNAFFRRTSS